MKGLDMQNPKFSILNSEELNPSPTPTQNKPNPLGCVHLKGKENAVNKMQDLKIRKHRINNAIFGAENP